MMEAATQELIRELASDQCADTKLDRPECGCCYSCRARAVLSMDSRSKRLTREQFEALLDACLGAANHAYWAEEYATSQRADIAKKAAHEAREKLLKAVFP